MKAISGLPPKCPSLTDLGGVTWRWDGVPNRGFNPSIITLPNNDKYAAVRRTNYVLDTKFGSLAIPSGQKHVKNVTEISKLSGSYSPLQWGRIKFIGEPIIARGLEDARLLVRGGDLFLNAVMLESHTPRARISIYKLDLASLEATHVKTYDGVDPKRPEKNWMTIDVLDSLDFEFVKEGPDGLRGGSSLTKFGDNYLAVCHKTYLEKIDRYNPLTFGIETAVVRRYTHLFVEYSKNLKILRMSKEFTFRQEGGIEFATSLVVEGNKILLAYGVNDSESWLAEISAEVVDTLLKVEQ